MSKGSSKIEALRVLREKQLATTKPLATTTVPVEPTACTVAVEPEEPEPRVKTGSSVLDSVHAVETASLPDSPTGCESPLCDVRFKQTGLKIEPRRFCSDQCKQHASIIRRAAKLFDGL